MQKCLSKLDYFTLSVLVELYEKQSATIAASQLNTTQPKISRALQHLRELFGDELFIRHQKGLAPNAVAESIYPKAKKILEQYRQLEPHLLSCIQTKELNIAAQPHLCPLLAKAFQLANEQCNTHYTVNFLPWTKDSQRQLAASQLDYCLTVNPTPEACITLYPIYEITRFLFVARKNHVALKRPITLENLFSFPMAILNYPYNSTAPHKLINLAEQLKQDYFVSLKTHDLNLLLGHIAETNDVGLMADILISKSILKNPQLAYVDISNILKKDASSNRPRPKYNLQLQSVQAFDAAFTEPFVQHIRRLIHQDAASPKIEEQ